MILIRGALVYTSEFSFEPKNILIDGEQISAILSDEELEYFQAGLPEKQRAQLQIVDAEGDRVIPGLIDIHLHGAFGCDFCDGMEDSIQKIAEYEAVNGVLGICPTTMSFPEDRLGDICTSILEHMESESYVGAEVLGINLEGPFLSGEKAGAQNKSYIQKADFGLFERLQESCNGLIRVVNIAPEVAGGMYFINAVSKALADKTMENVHVSIAHTDADYDWVCKAYDAGADHMTHTYNAMQGIDKRNPGPVLAAYEKNSYVEIITDGVHIHPAVVRMTFDLFDDDKVILVSDSMEATGLPDGAYELGGQAVSVSGNKAVLTDSEVIAGSVTNLYECMKTAVINMNIPIEKAVRAATYNPAASIGMADRYGIIGVGREANLVIIDNELKINSVYQRGSRIS